MNKNVVIQLLLLASGVCFLCRDIANDASQWYDYALSMAIIVSSAAFAGRAWGRS